MRVPLSWLREFVDVELTPEQLAERLTSLYDYILMRLLQGNLRNDVAANSANALTVTAVTTPAHGTAAITVDAKQVTYTATSRIR